MGFPGGEGVVVGDSVGPTNLKKCMKLNRNFQRGGRFFLGGGMDIFWNYRIQESIEGVSGIKP